jgi:hypothetical protein
VFIIESAKFFNQPVKRNLLKGEIWKVRVKFILGIHICILIPCSCFIIFHYLKSQVHIKSGHLGLTLYIGVKVHFIKTSHNGPLRYWVRKNLLWAQGHILHLPLILITKPSLLFKSCHIIVYGNKIIRTTLKVQILLHHLSDVLCLIKMNNKNCGTSNEQVIECMQGMKWSAVCCWLW